jgi:hypothetical protein
MDIFSFVVELLCETHLSVVGSDLEGVDAALVLERVLHDGVAAAVHVLGSELETKNIVL